MTFALSCYCRGITKSTMCKRRNIAFTALVYGTVGFSLWFSLINSLINVIIDNKGQKFTGSWLRSGNYNNYNNAYILSSAGAQTNDNTNNTNGLRPALHSAA